MRDGGEMYCTACGNKIADDVRFCPYCGASTAAGQSGVPASPATHTATAERGDLGSQVRRARRLSFAALSPTVLTLLVACFVFTTVAVAGMLVYFNIYLPAQRQQSAERQVVEVPQVAEESEQEPEDKPQIDAAAFSDKLGQYRTALQSNWDVGSDQVDEDVASVAGLFNGDGPNNAVTGDQAAWVPSYAVEDINDDDLPELVIALVAPDGSYRPLAVYVTDGTEVSALSYELPSVHPTEVTLRSDGSVETTVSGDAGSISIRASDGGEPFELGRLEWSASARGIEWRLYEHGELSDEGTAESFGELSAHLPAAESTPYQGLDWQSLSSYDGTQK